MDRWIFLIPLLPFLGFLVNGLLGRRLSDRAVAIIGCAALNLESIGPRGDAPFDPTVRGHDAALGGVMLSSWAW